MVSIRVVSLIASATEIVCAPRLAETAEILVQIMHPQVAGASFQDTAWIQPKIISADG
jgi:hypothetical protein